MQRFFVADVSLQVGQETVLDALAHQLHAVLRLAEGSEIVLLDGSGNEFLAQLTQVTSRHARACVVSMRPTSTEPALALTLYQCSLKQDKFEWVLQKGTELGVAAFVPVVSARSVVRPAAALQAKMARWQAIVREAAEQSGRGRLPVIGAPAEFKPAVMEHGVPGGKFILWEQAGGGVALGEAVVRWRQGQASRAMSHEPRVTGHAAQVTGRISLLIGPEGGLAADEVALATAHGWEVVSLGSRILRAETAALAAVAVAMERWGELGAATHR